MEEIFKNYPLLKNQNVPRETLIEFDLFISMLQKENEKMQKKKEEKKMNHLYLEKQMREKDERQKQTREIDLKEGAKIQSLPKHVINIFPRIIETPEHVRMQRKRGNVNNFKQQLDMQVRA